MKKHITNVLKMFLLLVVVTVFALIVDRLGIGTESITMIFLLGVLLTSVITGSRLWGIAASILSVVIFNFFFTLPRYSFQISSFSDLILLVFLLVFALITGTITSKLQRQQNVTRSNEQTIRSLYHIASGFLSVSGSENVIKKGQYYVSKYIGRNCYITTNENYTCAAKEQIFPIKSSNGSQGSLVLEKKELSPQQLLFTQAICTQMGITLEREKLAAEREKISLEMEREKQRSMLLRSVAHDLRSPLTALSGASSILDDSYDSLTKEERKKLASDICEESIWLNDLVENILNMTRINEQQLILHKEEEVVDDIIDGAVAHILRLMRDRSFTVSLPEEILIVPMDGKLITQVIVNLLENATRHTSIDAEVNLKVTTKGSDLMISVMDTGDGVAPEVKEKLFERYVSLDRRIVDGKKGIGLGLAICKTIVEAHGGVIWAKDIVPHGAEFSFTIPLSQTEVQEEYEDERGN